MTIRLPIVLSLLALALLSCGGHEDRHAGRPADNPEGANEGTVSKLGEPCTGAKHYAPAALSRLSTAPVYLPPDGAAGIRDAWVCFGDLSAPVFMMGDAQLSFETGWSQDSAVQQLRDLSIEYGGEFSQVNGAVAWLSPSSAPDVYNEVLMVKGACAIRLLSPSNDSFGDLKRVAESLVLTKPLGGSVGRSH